MTPRLHPRPARVSPAAALLALLPLLAVGAPLWAVLHAPVAPQDEGVVLAYPDVWLHGGVPNGSFESVYGVTWIWTMAAAFVAFGHSLLVERLVGLGYRLLMMLGVYLLVRAHGRVTAAISATLTGAVALVAFGSARVVFAAALPVFGATAFGLLALAAANRARETSSARAALVAGLCGGACLGFRPDFALPLAAGAAVVCLGWRRVDARAGVLGFVIALLPVWVNVLRAGPGRVLRAEVYEPVFVFPAGRHLPFSGLDTSVAVTAVATATLAVLGCALAWQGVREARPGARRLLSLAVFSLALTPYMASRWDLAHVGLVVMTSISLLPPMVRAAFSAGLRPLPRVVAAAATLLVVLASQQAFRPGYTEAVRQSFHHPMVHRVSNEGRTAIVATAADRRDLQLLLADVERVSTAPHPRLAVLPAEPAVAFYNDTFLYFLLPRFRPSTYYLEMEPGVANSASSRLADDLRRTDVVIANSRYDVSGEPNESGRRGSLRATRVLRSDFRQVVRHGPWRLLVRR